MAKPVLMLVLILISGAALSTTASGQQDTTLQMQCRVMTPTDDALKPDEIAVNGKACRPVNQGDPKSAVPPSKPPQTSNLTTPAQPAPATSESKKDPAAVQPTVARQCLILKRMGPADQITSHMYSFGIRGKQFQYVEGDFPPGVKFHGRLTDHDVRNIQSHNGRVVIMEPKYSADDLREAKQSCKQ